jgi:hypothetical protein
MEYKLDLCNSKATKEGYARRVVGSKGTMDKGMAKYIGRYIGT